MAPAGEDGSDTGGTDTVVEEVTEMTRKVLS